ncbi:MAG: toll/interleukin-1 receptor domain-containing protein [bacterium]|nr:toll/interleukin-1 receptor domain-containing protein [bacterium]MDI1347504.1 toll/interleukin-1 receptor domain-containing protein [Pseudolabrys sp.]
MSSLTTVERKPLEIFLKMSGGYVLDFSDRTFGEFVHEVVGVDIHSDCYVTNGTSKANKLRTFWKLEPDPMVGQLLTALVDYALFPENKPTAEITTLEQRCRQIVARLVGGAIAPVKAVTPSIFINYRRDDASAEALLVRDTLLKAFGAGSVFMDLSSIPAGAHWPSEIESSLKTSLTVIVIIGPNWLSAEEWGLRRIDNESDWVRRELEAALKSGQKVIPLLVKGGKLPPANALPLSIRSLLHLQAIEVRRDYWDHDIKLLVNALGASANAVITGVSTSGKRP